MISWREANQYLRLGNIPTIHIGYATYDSCDCVTWNEHHAYWMMTTRMLERGFTRIIYIRLEGTHNEHNPSFDMRKRGYEEAMAENQLDAEIRTVDEQFFFSKANGETLAQIIRENRTASNQPVVLVFSHDAPLLTAVAMLEAQEIKPGRDVHLCSVYYKHEVHQFSAVLERLSLRIMEPWQEVGRVAGQMMLSRLAGDNTDPKLMLVEPQMIEQF